MKLLLLSIVFLVSIVTLAVSQAKEQLPFTSSPMKEEVRAAVVTPQVELKSLPERYIIAQKKQVYQSYNNCGPASLSMALSYWNLDVSQEILGEKLRPYQVSGGNNDDKSVTFHEMATEAENYGLIAYARPHGSIELLKKLIAHNFPVLVTTWLHPHEDIGHYRLVRGYDDATQEIIQDDSYEGDNLRFSYQEFANIWEPFNYQYLVLTDKTHQAELETILGEDVSEKKAWENALQQAKATKLEEGEIPYSLFNQLVADYHLGNFEEAVMIYDQIKAQLPPRMLWYQIEPIQALAKAHREDEAIEVIDTILNRNNMAFTELHLIKGAIYQKQGKTELARDAYQKAVIYNIHNQEAAQALSSLE